MRHLLACSACQPSLKYAGGRWAVCMRRRAIRRFDAACTPAEFANVQNLLRCYWPQWYVYYLTCNPQYLTHLFTGRVGRGNRYPQVSMTSTSASNSTSTASSELLERYWLLLLMVCWRGGDGCITMLVLSPFWVKASPCARQHRENENTSLLVGSDSLACAICNSLLLSSWFGLVPFPARPWQAY